MAVPLTPHPRETAGNLHSPPLALMNLTLSAQRLGAVSAPASPAPPALSRLAAYFVSTIRSEASKPGASRR